jgi:hypothetical protein
MGLWVYAQKKKKQKNKLGKKIDWVGQKKKMG